MGEDAQSQPSDGELHPHPLCGDNWRYLVLSREPHLSYLYLVLIRKYQLSAPINLAPAICYLWAIKPNVRLLAGVEWNVSVIQRMGTTYERHILFMHQRTESRTPKTFTFPNSHSSNLLLSSFDLIPWYEIRFNLPILDEDRGARHLSRWCTAYCNCIITAIIITA